MIPRIVFDIAVPVLAFLYVFGAVEVRWAGFTRTRAKDDMLVTALYIVARLLWELFQ